MTSVSIHEAKTRLSALISEVEKSGEPISISRYGKVVAELAPPSAADRTRVSNELAEITVSCDLTEETGSEWENA